VVHEASQSVAAQAAPRIAPRFNMAAKSRGERREQGLDGTTCG
jgi:hypothetical protein